MKAISTDKAPGAIGPYSQGVELDCTGKMYFFSGQIAIDPATGNLVQSGTADETKRVMENIRGVLSAAGLDFSNVVKTTIFLKDMGDFQTVNEIYAAYFSEPYPARACVEAARLPKDVNVEIEVIANG